MKNSFYAFAAICFLIMTASCGILSKGTVDSLYNKHNREKVKIKDGLFSSKKASFGSYSTTSIEDGVNKRNISLSKQQNPFHFTLLKDEKAIVSVQAVQTSKKALKNKNLPESFYQSDVSKVFYAWISSNATNNLSNWELILKNPSYQELAKNTEVGVLQSTEDQIGVHANSRSGNVQSYADLSYEFQLKGIPVAAVQVNGKRQYVWIEPSLKQDIRSAVVGAIAAILLK